MAKKKIDIEKIFCPEANKLTIKRGNAHATILDEELDELPCEFNNDMCVNINTKGLDYIVLSMKNLEVLQKLILDAHEYYEKKYKAGFR